MKSGTWILTANSSIAKIFKVQEGMSLIEVRVLEHPESRFHTRDLVSDKPGTDSQSVGVRHHQMEQATSPKQLEFIAFVKEIASYLETERKNGSFKRLYLSASPNILGLLRQHLDPATIKLVSGEVDKDFTAMRASEIIKHLPFPVMIA